MPWQLGAHLVSSTFTSPKMTARRPSRPLLAVGAGHVIADHTASSCAPTTTSLVPPLDRDRATREAGLGSTPTSDDLAGRGGQPGRQLHDEGMAERVILASARSDIVAMCAQVASELPRSVLFASVHEEPVQLAQSVGADFVHPCWEGQPRPDQLLAGPWLARVRGRGLGVICWHEERPEVVKALYKLGVDGICTDEPPLLTQIASNP